MVPDQRGQQVQGRVQAPRAAATGRGPLPCYALGTECPVLKEGVPVPDRPPGGVRPGQPAMWLGVGW
eukprot:2556502-Rhodomonas_salina.1